MLGTIKTIKKGIAITNAFQNIIDKSERHKPKKDMGR